MGAQDQPDLAGTVLGGSYRIERLVGRGGMGAVYEAVGPGDRRVAIKVLRAAPDEAVLTRFLREGKIASRLEHPNLVPVLAALTDDESEHPFLVMPFLEGLDARALLEKARPLRPIVAARIALQACEGLAFAHAKDIVHRDIKPSNLFLEREPEGRVTVRVCDFGIAKMTGALELTQLTNTGVVMGTPLYVAPESMSGAPEADPRRDVYGIAATLYELLCGEPAWGSAKGEGFAALAVKMATLDPPRLEERAPWIDPALAALVHRALSRDPAARPSDAQAFAALLRPFCGDDVRLTTEMLAPFVRSDHDATEAPRAESDPLAAPDELLGARVGGDYRVLRLLGRGGMGSVYEAESAKDPSGPRVAVKVIAGELTRTDARAIQRFLREANAVRSIESPYVVRTLDVGTDSALGSPYLVMELLRGVDLGTFVKQHGALETRPALRVFLQAARGISAAHEKGVIHRDVKPANLFLHVGEDERITVKVCDFGIAKQAPSELGDALSHGLTSTGGMLGSPRYMSPEQAQDAKRVDRRSDVWSFCISLYETLSGRRAWGDCTSLGEIIVAICTRPIRPLRELAPWVDAEVAAIVQRGLAIDAENRWQSLAELADALAEHAGDTSVSPTLADLRAVSRDLLAVDTSPAAAGLADAGSIGDAGGFSTQHTIDREPPARPRPNLSRFAAIGVAAVVIGGYVYSTNNRARVESPPSVVASPPAPAPALSASAVRLLAISPPDGRVTVDGHVVEIVNGAIELTGQPGDAFEVIVSKDSVHTRSRVFVTSDHRLEPARVELAPAVSAAVAPASSASAKRPVGLAPRPPVAVPSAVTPQPSAAPIKPRENW